jgi:hypothetical protein
MMNPGVARLTDQGHRRVAVDAWPPDVQRSDETRGAVAYERPGR